MKWVNKSKLEVIRSIYLVNLWHRLAVIMFVVLSTFRKGIHNMSKL